MSARRPRPLGPRVWIAYERVWGNLGAERWVVQVWDLTPAAKLREEAWSKDHPGEAWEWEPDRDVGETVYPFPTQAEAQAKARELVASGELFFGSCNVQRQVVDWFVEEDNVAEWTDVGEAEEFS